MNWAQQYRQFHFWESSNSLYGSNVNQRGQYLDGQQWNSTSHNVTHNRHWTAKRDFERPQKRVTGPYTTSKYPSISRRGIKTTQRSSIVNTRSTLHSVVKNSNKGTSNTGTVRSADVLKSQSADGNSSLTKDASAKVKSSLSHKPSQNTTTKSTISGKTDQDQNRKITPNSSESRSTAKPSCKPSTSAHGENNNGVGKSIDSSECLSSGNKLPQETITIQLSTSANRKNTGVCKSANNLQPGNKLAHQETKTDQARSSSSLNKKIEPAVISTAQNIKAASNVNRTRSELEIKMQLKKITKISNVATSRLRTSPRISCHIGKISVNGAVSPQMEKTATISKGDGLISKAKDNANMVLTSGAETIETTQESNLSNSNISGNSPIFSSVLQRSKSSSSVVLKSPSASIIGKSPPVVTRLNHPKSNSEPGEKDLMMGHIPVGANCTSADSSSGALMAVDEDASVTRVQLPPSLQRELTKLLVKSQGPQPRPNLAAARSRLHAGEHHQAQVVESPDKMVQQLLMKLLDSPKSHDRQVQQIEELQRLLVQASKRGSERARFGVQQLPEVSLEALESLLKSGQLRPLFSETNTIGVATLDQNLPTIGAEEQVDSKKTLRRLINGPDAAVNLPILKQDTQNILKQGKPEPEMHVKAESTGSPQLPLPINIAIKTEPDIEPTPASSSTVPPTVQGISAGNLVSNNVVNINRPSQGTTESTGLPQLLLPLKIAIKTEPDIAPTPASRSTVPPEVQGFSAEGNSNNVVSINRPSQGTTSMKVDVNNLQEESDVHFLTSTSHSQQLVSVSPHLPD